MCSQAGIKKEKECVAYEGKYQHIHPFSYVGHCFWVSIICFQRTSSKDQPWVVQDRPDGRFTLIGWTSQ
jgi:hypothetical protein